jgi:hypothetical protein
MFGTDYQDWLADAAFALMVIILALSLAAYGATREKRLLIVSLAFALWAYRLGVNALATFAFPDWEGATWVETQASVLDLAAAALLFFAIVKRERAAD